MQNRLEDLGSLLRFLRIFPFDNQTTFRQTIIEPLLTGSHESVQRLRLLLKLICLRRTKAALNLPDLAETEVLLDLSDEERTQYASVLEDSKKAIDASISSKAIKTAYNGIFYAILRLRLLCDHGTFTRESRGLENRRRVACTDQQELDGFESGGNSPLSNVSSDLLNDTLCSLDLGEIDENENDGENTTSMETLSPARPEYPAANKRARYGPREIQTVRSDGTQSLGYSTKLSSVAENLGNCAQGMKRSANSIPVD